jgi:hypothetical protein
MRHIRVQYQISFTEPVDTCIPFDRLFQPFQYYQQHDNRESQQPDELDVEFMTNVASQVSAKIVQWRKANILRMDEFQATMILLHDWLNSRTLVDHG